MIIVLLISGSCTETEERSEDKKPIPDTSSKAYYQRRMKEKNFDLSLNGPCDDALRDTMHERGVAYIDNETRTDSNVVIEFKFIDACCQDFLGDYSIRNDTLTFLYEQVNEIACSCVCWYRYKLTINEARNQYASIEIREK